MNGKRLPVEHVRDDLRRSPLPLLGQSTESVGDDVEELGNVERFGQVVGGSKLSPIVACIAGISSTARYRSRILSTSVRLERLSSI